MLPRKHRLTEDKDIKRVLKNGRVVFTNLLTIKAVPNKEGNVRTAIIVSTKVDKRSTKRNIIKRRIREVLVQVIPKIKVPVDLVITAKNEALDREQDAFASALSYCLSKLRII
jgi:ribonuclease P protein component